MTALAMRVGITSSDRLWQRPWNVPEQKTVIGTGPEATLNWLREGRGAVGVFVRVGGDSIRLWTAY